MHSERTVPVDELRSLLPALLLFSFVTNLTMLISPLFMMQMIDRVLPSGNLHTLVLLLGIALIALLLSAAIEHARNTALTRSARWIEAHGTAAALNPGMSGTPATMQDVIALRDFLSGGAAATLLNLPWLPFYLLILLIIDSSFLFLTLGALIVLALMSRAPEFLNRTRNEQAATMQAEGANILKTMEQHANTASILSLGTHLKRRFSELLMNRHLAEAGGETGASISRGIAEFTRSSAQICALALGAYLVIHGELSAGSMIGASIIAAKTLATGEAAVSGLQSFGKAMAAYGALRTARVGHDRPRTIAGRYRGALRAENLIYPRGGGAPPRIDRITFSLKPGETLAIVGDSGSSKSSLLHALCGADPAPIGSVFLDDTEISTLDRISQNKLIGYLPQQAVLLNGTIAQNIACFDPDAEAEQIVTAARFAGVHGMISALPQAYDTDYATNAHFLSAGQVQRIALARAVFNRPRFLFLDEPNALMDSQGERDLFDALVRMKNKGTTVVFVVHRSGITKIADKMLRMDAGKMVDFGPASEVSARIGDRRRWIKIAADETASQDLMDWVARQFSRAEDADMRKTCEVVVGGMFRFLLLVGSKRENRTMTFRFIFQDPHSFSITVTEDVAIKLGGKFKKVRDLLKSGGIAESKLSPDEEALAIVLDAVQDLKAELGDTQTQLTASLRHTPGGDAARKAA